MQRVLQGLLMRCACQCVQFCLRLLLRGAAPWLVKHGLIECRRVGLGTGHYSALTRLQSDAAVCIATGKNDMDTTPFLRDALTEARGDNNAHLVVDLSAVTSMDLAGLYALFESLRKHNIGGGRLATVVDSNSRRVIPERHLVALEAALDLRPRSGRDPPRLRQR